MEPDNPPDFIEIRRTDLKPFPASHLVQDAGFIPARYSQIIFMHTYKYTLMVSSPHV